MATTANKRTGKSEGLALTPGQCELLLDAKAWWQEGERALDYLAERARQQSLLAELAAPLERLRGARDPDARKVAPLLRLTRLLSANRALNRTLETDAFARSLRVLLYGDEPLPVRLSTFLTESGVGALTASQMLCAAYPDHYPLVSARTRAVLAPSLPQQTEARRAVRREYVIGPEISPEALALLGDFALYEEARKTLGVESFLDVNAILWHAREMPADGSRSRKHAVAPGRVREDSPQYAAPSAREATEADLLEYIEGFIAAQGFTYPELAVRDYYIALKTKPFVILAGLSGTGKTRLTELIAEAIAGDVAAQYRILAVRPDWTDATALLGYYNVLTETYTSTPFLDLLRAANRPENAGRAYFVCLDEMNLARVEHYLADLLSAMETRQRALHLHGAESVVLPPNVHLTGSVNVDEATHPFSRKVLDRANTIEFSQVRLSQPAGAQAHHHPASLPEIAPRERQRLFLSARARDFADAEARLRTLGADYPERLREVLSALNEMLEPRGFHTGYRVRDEASAYVANAFAADGTGLLVPEDRDANLATALDFQILQKVLPRVSGTQEALDGLLARLESWAGERGYHRTRAKLTRMRRRAAEDGLVTFYEP